MECLDFGSGGGGSSRGLTAKRLCVTAQLRGSAFDAFNIRTSELFFILRRKVRVSQPGQIAQGKFPFPFVGPPAFICWGCTFQLPHREKKAHWAQASAANLGPEWEAGAHLGTETQVGTVRGTEAQTKPKGRGCSPPEPTPPLRDFFSPGQSSWSGIPSTQAGMFLLEGRE